MSLLELYSFWSSLANFLRSNHKKHLLIHLLVATEIEFGKFRPKSEQHLKEHLRDLFTQYEESTDKELMDLLSDEFRKLSDSEFMDFSEFSDFERLMERLVKQRPKREKAHGTHNTSFKKRSEDSVLQLLLSATEEQKSVAEKCAQSNGPVILQGYAGCGKTSVLEMIYYSEPARKKETLFSAFNRDIVNSVGYHNPELECLTFDQLGFKLGLRKSPWHRELISTGSVNYPELSAALGIKPNSILSGYENISGHKITRLVYMIIERYSNSYSDCWTDNLITSEITSLDARNQLLMYAENLWAAMVATPDLFQSPMLKPSFVTKHWSLTNGKIPPRFSRLFLDEAQDVNGAFARVLDNSPNLQIITAGDRYQQLYGWRGAINAMDKMEGSRLSVTCSFRYGEDLSGFSNTLLSLISDAPKEQITSYNPDINTKIIPYEGVAPQGDVVLARSRASIFEIARKLANENTAFHLNLDIPEWAWLLSSSLALYNGENDANKHRLILPHDSWFQLESWAETAMDTDLLTCIKIVKKYSDTLMKDLKKIGSLNVAPDYQGCVILSTTHKIKGRDWDRVVLADDFLNIIEKENVTPGQIDEELCIIYVALTRAKKELHLPSRLYQWITEKASQMAVLQKN